MDSRRKACYLLLMLLLDLCSGGHHQGDARLIPTDHHLQRPANDLDDQDDFIPDQSFDGPMLLRKEYERIVRSTASSVLGKQSQHPRVVNAVVEKMENIIEGSLLDSKDYFLDLLKRTVDEYHLKDVLQPNNSMTCDDIHNNTLFRIDGDVPLAPELYDFSLLITFVAYDCDNASLEILQELETRLDGPEEVLDVILDFIDGVLESDDDDHGDHDQSPRSLDNHTQTTSKDAKTIVRDIELIINQVRALEPLIWAVEQESHSCSWILQNTTSCELFDEQASFGTLDDAKAACIERKQLCFGVMKVQLYHLVRSCSNDTHIKTYFSRKVWLKDCDINSHHVKRGESAHSFTTNAVTFYEHAWYKGRQERLQGKVDYIGNHFSNKISSFYCDWQCNVMVFEQSEMGGKQALYQGSVGNLGYTHFNEKISSVLILPYEVCVKVYEHSQFRGASKRFCSDVRKMTDFGFNDKISSMKVECGHCSVVVYEHSKYSGNYEAFHGNVAGLSWSWNDKISSLQIRPWPLKGHKGCKPNHLESKVHSYSQYIPFFSFFYNLCSSIAYGIKGCSQVAKQRALDTTIDFAIDGLVAVAMVFTGGSAGLAGSSAKEVIKNGIKAGAMSAGRALANTVKRASKQKVSTINDGKVFSKKGLKNELKNDLKNTIKAIKAVKTLPQNAERITKIMSSNISHFGKKALQNIPKNDLKDSLKGISQIVDLDRHMVRKLDDRVVPNIDAALGSGSKHAIRRRTNDGPADISEGKVRCSQTASGQCYTPKPKHRHSLQNVKQIVNYSDTLKAIKNSILKCARKNEDLPTIDGEPNFEIDETELITLYCYSAGDYKGSNEAECRDIEKWCHLIIDDSAVLQSALTKLEGELLPQNKRQNK